MKQHLYIAQLSESFGEDIAWCTWLVLAHDLDVGDVNTFRRVDEILKQVPVELFDPKTEDYKDVDALVAEITPALEAKGFEVLGPAHIAFLSCHQ